MAAAQLATWMLEREARAMLTRLERVKPFAVQETMLPQRLSRRRRKRESSVT